MTKISLQGLGPPEGTVLPGKPFFISLLERAVIPVPWISFFFHGGLSGELILGGADPKHNATVHKWCDCSRAVCGNDDCVGCMY